MSRQLLREARTWLAIRRAGHTAVAAAAILLAFTTAHAEVSQTPLYLGGGNVPGNLVLTPSVEWPTINSLANLGAYNETRGYLGYFDARKCYVYVYNANEALRHFNPTRFTTDHICGGANEWSGNYLNWAATQTIDPFRSALTGGDRVRDTATETWLEKARHDGQGGTGIFPNRRLPAAGANTTLVRGATPAGWDSFRTRIQGLGNKMRFIRASGTGDVNAAAATVVPYDPAVALDPVSNVVYEVSVRVAVCVAGLREPNCREYSSAWKPEGLIQQYSEDLRIGVFGYLNDPSMLRDGAALRARQKFVSPLMIAPGVQGQVANPEREWDPVTGVLIQNPNAADAAATAGVTITNSGAINYLNKFGQLTTNNHKNFDPVSELYYTALRYLQNEGNVPEYTAVPGNTGVTAARAADGFPIITSWDDPIQYACQKNIFLGIGDVYTHRDKNLPGNSTYMTEEPTKPAVVASDTTADVITWTNRVGAMEGLGNIANNNNWSGRNNSAYLAGLAYFARTTDIRQDIPGTQTASTYWVDVREAQTVEAPVRNQYYLATKYGGFKMPEDFDPFTDALQLDWWHTNGDTLISGVQPSMAGTSFARPDNYFVAGEADRMVAGLTEAFAKILAEVRSSASSVAANSTRIGTDTAVFQAAFDSRRWSGELKAFRIGTGGAIAVNPDWSASQQLDALTEGELATRKIFTVLPPTAGSGGSLRVDGRHRLSMGVADSCTAGRPAPDAERRSAGHTSSRPGPPRVPARLATERSP